MIIDTWGSVAAFRNCSVALFRYDRLSVYHLQPRGGSNGTLAIPANYHHPCRYESVRWLEDLTIAMTRLHEIEENIEIWCTYLCAQNRVWFSGGNTTLYLTHRCWCRLWFSTGLCDCLGWCLMISPIRVNKNPVLNGVLHVLWQVTIF